MLMLLRIAAKAAQPFVVPAHLLRPDLHHRRGNGVWAAQRGQVGDGAFDRGGVQVALAGDTGVAAFLAFRCFLQHNDLGAQVVGGDRGGDAGGAKADDDDIRFHIPRLWVGTTVAIRDCHCCLIAIDAG
jgi:hypothetical protein